jgi:hypothetical protein
LPPTFPFSDGEKPNVFTAREIILTIASSSDIDDVDINDVYDSVFSVFPCREPYCIITVRIEPGSVLVTITFTVVESGDASTDIREMEDLLEKTTADVGDSIFSIPKPTDVNFEVTPPFLVVLPAEPVDPQTTRFELVVSLLVAMCIIFCAIVLVVGMRRSFVRGSTQPK